MRTSSSCYAFLQKEAGNLYLQYTLLSVLLPGVLFKNSLPVNGVTKTI